MKTNLFAIITAIAVGYCGIDVSACTNPLDRTSAGIVFNNGENMDLSHLQSLGQGGVNYYSRETDVAIPQSGIKQIKILTPATDPINWNDPVEITSLGFFNNFLFIDVQYGGGCTTHEFMLYADSLLSNDKPAECNLTFLHNANGDACKALIKETLCFNLAPFQSIHPDIAPVKFTINGSGPHAIWYPDNARAIMYRSHYDNSAMVYLSYSSLYKYSQTGVFPVMRIITDTLTLYESPLDYGKYVTSELKWLLDNKVIENSGNFYFEIIEQSIGNTNKQYWTLQDSSLSYGSYFEYDLDSTGTYIWGEVVPDMRNCSEDTPFMLPPKPLGTTAILPSVKKAVANRHITAKLNGNTFQITGDNLKSGMRIELIDLQGNIAEKSCLVSNHNGFIFTCTKSLHAGMYYLRINNGSTRVLSNVVKLK